jgi:membrane protein insertase Oxa1/YidC/SpoIIIJ
MMLQWHLPSAFVLYWFLSNVLMVAQQWWINRSIVLPAPAAAGGVLAPSAAAAAAFADTGKNDAGAAAAAAAAPAPANGADNGQAARPMAPNPKLISPKNRKNRRK